MPRCQVCEKTNQIGHNRSHSQRATRKVSRPNVFRRNVTVNGEKKAVYMCTRCMRNQVKTA
jgi:large subunit ribosomal protein L28